MHRFFCALILCVCCCFAVPAHAETYTLEGAVIRALKANPGVEARLHALDRAKMNIGVAQSYFWPRVSLVSSNNILQNAGDAGSTDDLSSTSYTHGWRVSYPLFAGFAHLNNLLKSKLNAEMDAARYDQAELELIANVQLQFLNLLKAREDLKTVEESISRLETQLKSSEAFVNVGMAPYANVLQNKVDLSKAQQEKIRVQNRIRNTEVQLNQYLGYPPNQKMTYKGSLKDFFGEVGYSEEQAIKMALCSRPDLIIAQKSIAVAFKDLNMTLGEYLPRVDINYDKMEYEKDYDSKRYKDYSRSYWAVGLNVTWDVFTGGSTTFGALGGRKQVLALQKEYENTMTQARTDVIRALLDIKAAKDLIKVSRVSVDSARESYAMANKRYLTNSGTITELLDAQMRLTQAQTDASQALLEFHSARAKFYFNIGQKNVPLK